MQSFFGNRLYWQAAALALDIGQRLCILALRRARGKRLRLAFSRSLPGWCVTVAACTRGLCRTA